MKIRSLLPLIILSLPVVLASGCTPAAPSPTLTDIPSSTVLPATVTFTPSPQPSATSTVTLTPTATWTPTPADTDTPTATLTPSLTLTPTPQYNLPGDYPLGLCAQYQFNYADPTPGKTGMVRMCIVDVVINHNGSMQFNILWHLLSMTGSLPSRYVYGKMIAVYLTDEFGNRYNPVANSGKEPDRDSNKDGQDSISGWYLFPPPEKEATLFTLHDDEGRNIKIGGMWFITR